MVEDYYEDYRVNAKNKVKHILQEDKEIDKWQHKVMVYFFCEGMDIESNEQIIRPDNSSHGNCDYVIALQSQEVIVTLVEDFEVEEYPNLVQHWLIDIVWIICII